MTGFIRTLGGDLPVELAGPTYVHEHLIIDSPLVAAEMPHIHLPSVDEAVAEVRTCVTAGVRTMVDAMPAAAGRNPEKLSEVSIFTGMRVVAATGLHTGKYYPDVTWAAEESPEALASRFIADIEDGIDQNDYRGEKLDRTALKAGLVKVASLTETLSDRDLRLFESAAITHTVTGAPILTHTEGGRGGLHQIECLVDLGVGTDHIALSHTDKVDDRGYHRAMLETGALLCYDQGLRDLSVTRDLTSDMVEDGYAAQILLGTDGARRSLWSSLGGSPGLASLYIDMGSTFDPSLLRQVFVDNPARYLSFDR